MKTGKITAVNVKTSKVIIEGITVKKQDGSKANIKMRPSNLQIIELNLDDKKRMKQNKDENKKTESKEEKKGSEQVQASSLKNQERKEEKK